MKILLADKISESGLGILREAGHDVVPLPRAKGDELTVAIRNEKPQVLIVRSTRVTAEMMEASPALELIVRAGAGYDNIDVESASSRGIFVSNCPGRNSDAVAELTIGLMLALDRRIPDNVSDARAGRWNKGLYSSARGIKGATLGIVGLGNIGARVAALGQALGMSVVAWSRSLTDEKAEELGVLRKSTPVDVAAASDVVSLHVSAASETRGLANDAFFQAMKPGAIFINTTRSSVVDEGALRRALDEKGIFAGLDVMEGEPAQKEGSFEHPLAGHPNVYITHHIGASTEQAQDAIAEEAIRIVNVYDESGHVPNCVNIERHSPATHLLTVRHLDKVGVLAAVLDEVRKGGWNVQEMENLIFAGARAACARITFNGSPSDEVVRRIEDHPDVLAVSILAL
ncbi:MAG: 3-phosphoglycerate dehydrogenase [Rhodothermales bacterium]